MGGILFLFKLQKICKDGISQVHKIFEVRLPLYFEFPAKNYHFEIHLTLAMPGVFLASSLDEHNFLQMITSSQKQMPYSKMVKWLKLPLKLKMKHKMLIN